MKGVGEKAVKKRRRIGGDVGMASEFMRKPWRQWESAECWSHAGILTGTESRTGPDKQFVPSDLIYIDVELEEGCQSFRQHDRLDREKRRADQTADKPDIRQPQSHRPGDKYQIKTHSDDRASTKCFIIIYREMGCMCMKADHSRVNFITLPTVIGAADCYNLKQRGQRCVSLQ